MIDYVWYFCHCMKEVFRQPIKKTFYTNIYLRLKHPEDVKKLIFYRRELWKKCTKEKSIKVINIASMVCTHSVKKDRNYYKRLAKMERYRRRNPDKVIIDLTVQWSNMPSDKPIKGYWLDDKFIVINGNHRVTILKKVYGVILVEVECFHEKPKRDV